MQLVSRSKELDSLTGERNKIRQLKQKLSKDRHDQFLTGFQIITLKLKEIYQVRLIENKLTIHYLLLKSI